MLNQIIQLIKTQVIDRLFHKRMKKVSIILVIYNAKRYIKPVFESIFKQSHSNIEVVAVINGNADGSKEIIARDFPKVKIIDPGKNLWFAAGNNLAINQTDGEFVFLVNQDVILTESYLEQALLEFSDENVAAVTGKLLKYDFEKNQKTNLIDTTGVIMSKSGRARDRGQGEPDNQQYDSLRDVFGVSGACPVYRRSALEAVKDTTSGKSEFFDEDFIAYWEDVDLSWRFNNMGFKCRYAPNAVGYHGRTAAQAAGGYLKIFNFIKHHRKLPAAIKKLNFKNHFWMYIKNSPTIHPKFIIREILMFFFILIFETSTLSVLPELLKKIPQMRRKGFRNN